MNRLAPSADRAVSRRGFIGARWQVDNRPTRSIATIGTACLSSRGVACRICAEHCDLGAIGFRPSRGGIVTPIVDPAACTGCGACLTPCPAGAIALRAQVSSCA